MDFVDKDNNVFMLAYFK